MAKRKRLNPARTGFFDPAAAAPETADGRAASPPIATIAGDASIVAAFDEVRNELVAARSEGRMVVSLPLSAIVEDYLIRDRLHCEDEDMQALKASILARGQQTPVDVVDLGDGSYGLLSGWRRIQALKDLSRDTGAAQFATVQALLRRPEDRSAAYVAMIEENEIRANLSYYERARVALRAVQSGVYETEKQALQTLFSTASFARRSKIKSFMPLVQTLDDVLQYPAQIPERLGLALSRAVIGQDGFAIRVRAELSVIDAVSAKAERLCLEQTLRKGVAATDRQGTESVSVKKPASMAQSARMSGPALIAPGIHIRARRGRVELEGEGVNSGMIERLQDWLRSQG